MTAPRFHRLRIASLRKETADSVVLGFTVPEALRAAYRFSPGQFVTLRARVGGVELRRPYSICSDPGAAELRVGIRLLPGGRFSCFAGSALSVGEAIDVLTPDGRFGLTPAPGARRGLLFLAAGAGITPILPMLRAVLAAEAGRAILIRADRARGSIMFRAEIEALKDRHMGRFAFAQTLSRETVEGALAGRLDAAVLARLLGALAPDGVDHAFLCGPDGFAAALAPALGGARAVTGEVFSPAPDAGPVAPVAAAPDAPPFAWASVTYQGVRTRVPLAEGESVIAAGLRAGLELPFACRGGMCCTCRARLTAGEVRMETNYSLEAWEMAAGYVLACQARAVTGEVGLDFDAV